jgi:hypothetical protein
LFYGSTDVIQSPRHDCVILRSGDVHRTSRESFLAGLVAGWAVIPALPVALSRAVD